MTAEAFSPFFPRFSPYSPSPKYNARRWQTYHEGKARPMSALEHNSQNRKTTGAVVVHSKVGAVQPKKPLDLDALQRQRAESDMRPRGFRVRDKYKLAPESTPAPTSAMRCYQAVSREHAGVDINTALEQRAIADTKLQPTEDVLNKISDQAFYVQLQTLGV